MSEKRQPLGVCDHCLGPIPQDIWYTSKGKERLHCSDDCKNTANSRAGAQIRRRKMKERVARDEWQNPHHLRPPTPQEQSARARKGRLREVEDGAWRNPALSQQARKKLSRPRKHSGVLHTAIEKLRRGKMDDLSEAEARAYRAYRRALRTERKQEVNRKARENYRKRQAALTPTEREAQRARWRALNHRRRRGVTGTDLRDDVEIN